MENRKLFLIMISVTGVVFLLVLVAVTMMLRSRNTNSSSNVTPVPAYISPTPVNGVVPTKGSELLSDKEYENFPFKIATAVPEEFATMIRNNSAEGSTSFDITYTSTIDSFAINFITLETEPGSVQKDRAKFIPPLYDYEKDNFIQLVAINGQQLVVSKTGAAELVQEGDTGIIRGVPEMSARTVNGSNEYYVYQVYNGKLSEYISAFNSSAPAVADYDNSYIVTYFIKDEADKANWATNQKLLQESLQGIQKSRN